MGRCPSGVVCIENITVVFIIIIALVIFAISVYMLRIRNTSEKALSKYTLNILNDKSQSQGLYARPGYTFSNVENDVLLNPYQAPVRDNRIFPGVNYSPNRVPINVPTQIL